MKRKIEKIQTKGSAFKKLAALALMLTLITPVVTKAQAGKTNFAGDWTLNTEKSTLPQGGQGGGMRMGGGNFVATQDGNVLTVVRTRNDQNGQPATITMKYTLDGKESINTSPEEKANR